MRYRANGRFAKAPGASSAPACCTGPECARPQLSKGLCSGHYRQLRQGRELYVIGDRERLSRVHKERAARMSPEQRRAQVEAMAAAVRGKPRDPQWVERQQAAQRHRWANGDGPPKEPRTCWGCETVFQPNSAGHWYCTVECQRISKRLKSKYGITRMQYAALLEAQDGKCALCRNAWQGWGYIDKLVVDHCHTTGKIRGLLCGECNTALGRFGDDPVRLRAAAEYLERAARDGESTD